MDGSRNRVLDDEMIRSGREDGCGCAMEKKGRDCRRIGRQSWTVELERKTVAEQRTAGQNFFAELCLSAMPLTGMLSCSDGTRNSPREAPRHTHTVGQG